MRTVVEANEEIVSKWLEEVKGFFVITDVKYPVTRGWSDIDIIAINPKTDEAWVVEVKGWHTQCITPSLVDEIAPQLSKEALREINNRLGGKTFKRILVVPMLSKNQKTKNKTIAMFKQKYQIDDIKEFSQILDEMLQTINEHQDYDSEILQTLRLLKRYQKIKT